MNYGNIKFCDISNGAGVRTSLFVSGCTHRCKGCFNPETWDFDYGKPFTDETAQRIIDSCRPGYISGLSILGGEPMEPVNQRDLLEFVRRFRDELPDKNIWCYSGCTFEELIGIETSSHRCEATDELLGMIDILVDGRFQEDKYDITLRFRGSANQRIIDVKRSLSEKKAVLWQDDKLFSSHEI